MKDYGYIAAGENGAIRVRGARQTDEVHTAPSIGTVNVTAIWEDIRNGVAKARIKSCWLDENALAGIENKDLDEATLAHITKDRAELPIIGILLPGGSTTIADGNHRMAWRQRRGDKTFLAWIFHEDAIKEYAVEISLAPDPLGPWEAQSTADLLGITTGIYVKRDATGKVVGTERR